MDISVSPALKLMIDVLKENCTKRQISNRFEFKELLKTANAIEKYIIAKAFCQNEWNIGSLAVLGVLQELRILTAKEFILGSENVNELILNDFLEAEFELLGNLLISATYDTISSERLNFMLDECFQNLFNDLLQNQNLNDLGYLKALKSQLRVDVLRKLTLKHVFIILKLHKSSVKGAFQKFSTWINEGVDELNFTKVLYEVLIAERDIEVLNYLFKLSTNESFKEWKFYLIMLQTIASNCRHDTTRHIRKYLRNRIHEIKVKEDMMHFLLSARALTATTHNVDKNLKAYADWYRENIAEMKFVLKGDDFRIICELLEQCISYEMEEDYLAIHASISISPPVMFGKLVQGYKSQCKFRLMQIKSKGEGCLGADDQTILIDSD